MHFMNTDISTQNESLMILWNIWKNKSRNLFTINETIVYKMRNVGKIKKERV